MTLTQTFILVAIIIIAAFDLYQLNAKGYQATISATIVKLSVNWPIIPFIAGLLCGHLWMPYCG